MDSGWGRLQRKPVIGDDPDRTGHKEGRSKARAVGLERRGIKIPLHTESQQDQSAWEAVS